MSETRSPESGLFVTNHLNMMFSLAAGFITPPSGFGDKYYRDTLSERPGWIPLFIYDKHRHRRKRVPKSAINLSKEEAKYLIPVIIEINLENLVLSDSVSDSIVQTTLFGDILPDKEMRFALAPISTTEIRRIYVESPNELDKIQSQAELRNNVFLKPKILRNSKTLFGQGTLKKWTWQYRNKRPEENIPIYLAQAAGGILAMLYHIRNKSSAATKTYTVAFRLESKKCPIPGLKKWMLDGSVLPISRSVKGYLLWSLVKKIAEHRDGSSDYDLDNIVLNFLESIPEKNQHQTVRICNTLTELGGLGGATISEYFGMHKNPLERALILFFMRRQCEELLDFKNEKMSALDWIYSAILFGARSGWLRLPLELRGEEEFRDKICERMTDLCHQKTPRFGPDHSHPCCF